MIEKEIKYKENLDEIKALLCELESRFLSEEYNKSLESIEKNSKRITNIIREESIVSNNIMKEKFYLK
ncbi:hypothetical protein M0Q97_10935 [Candidatus Dojkabacteria bacterium]|jgi:hypothetical protein|nr:hypothetical protein [Candidatus Dojkabacteria bacterium]